MLRSIVYTPVVLLSLAEAAAFQIEEAVDRILLQESRFEEWCDYGRTRQTLGAQEKSEPLPTVRICPKQFHYVDICRRKGLKNTAIQIAESGGLWFNKRKGWYGILIPCVHLYCSVNDLQSDY